MELGELYRVSESWKDAYEAYLKAREYQNDGYVNMRLGYSCYYIDKLEDALSFFKDNLNLVLKVYINQAMESQKDRDIQTCIRGGHSEAADILRRS